MLSDKEQCFVFWLVTQKNARGSFYLERVARQYVRYLRTSPYKFKLSLSENMRNVFDCNTLEEFDKLVSLFISASNYKEVNAIGHNSFSAGLSAYRKYLEYCRDRGKDAVNNTANSKYEKDSLMSTYNDSNESMFEAWMIKSGRSESTSNSYSTILRGTLVSCLNAIDIVKTNLFEYGSIEEFEKAKKLLCDLPNFTDANQYKHNSLSAALKAYEDYLKSISNDGSCNLKITNNDLVVDFNHTELCAWSSPISCNIDGISIQVGTWRDLLKNIIEEFIARGNECVTRLFTESLFKRSSQPFFLKEHPKGRAKQLSNGYWIYINYSIPQLVDIIGKLCTYCGYSTDDVIITYSSKHDDMQVETPINDDKTLDESGLNAVLGAIKSNYSMGLDFSPTTLRLLENKSQIEISAKLQAELKKLMFKRNDGIYLLTEQIINQENFDKLQTAIRGYMDEFSCFELPKIYITYSSFFDDKLIRDCDDFEDWLKFSGLVRQTRCVGQYGTRIVRKSDRSIQELFTAISVRISTIANDNYGGVIEEEYLENNFMPFSAQLLFNIVKDYTENLVRTEINGIFCYQTLDALGLSDDFSDMLDNALSQIDDLGLVPNEETLNTVLSITMGLNFRVEYNLMEGKTFRRLIAHYYKNNIKREWRGGVFMEVRD